MAFAEISCRWLSEWGERFFFNASRSSSSLFHFFSGSLDLFWIVLLDESHSLTTDEMCSVRCGMNEPLCIDTHNLLWLILDKWLMYWQFGEMISHQLDDFSVEWQIFNKLELTIAKRRSQQTRGSFQHFCRMNRSASVSLLRLFNLQAILGELRFENKSRKRAWIVRVVIHFPCKIWSNFSLNSRLKITSTLIICGATSCMRWFAKMSSSSEKTKSRKTPNCLNSYAEAHKSASGNRWELISAPVIHHKF